MPTTVAKLAGELGRAPFEVLAACRHAGIDTFGESTPLDDREAARVRAVLTGDLPAVAPAPPSTPPPGQAAGDDDRFPLPVAILLGVLVVGIVVVAASMLLHPSDGAPDVLEATPPRPTVTTVPRPTTTTELRAAGLSLGDCWDDSSRAPLKDLADEAGVFPLVTRCEGAHQAEVYAVVEWDGADTYPGDEAFGDWASDQCLFRYGQFVGVHIEDSVMDALTLFPSERQFLLGDRTISCSVYPLDGVPLYGSAAGSGR